MKAAVMYGVGDIRIEEVEKPAIKKDEVLIKVKAIGICGSDMHFYDGTHPYSNYPRIYGHEISGEIVEVGETAGSWMKGDRVVLEPTLACGKCYPCRHGKYNCCVDLNIIGVHSDGGFAEYVTAPATKIFAMPEGMGYDIASLAEPYSIGAQAYRRANITKDDSVVIIGVGTIGMTVLDIAKSVGAQVMVADLHPFRLDIARLLGADEVVDTGAEDLLSRVMAWTANEGAGVVVEATGVPRVAETTHQLVANGGRVVILGVLNQNISFPGIKLTNKEMTILGSRNSAGNFPFVLDGFADQSLHPEIIMTKKFSFAEIRCAFTYIKENLDKVGKVVIEMDL